MRVVSLAGVAIFLKLLTRNNCIYLGTGKSGNSLNGVDTVIGTTPYYTWFNCIPEYSDTRIFRSHVCVLETDVTRQKLDPRTFLGLYLESASTTHVTVYYNPSTKKIGHGSHVYFNEQNVGLNSPHKPRFGTELIKKYSDVPNANQFQVATSNITNIPNLQHPITTYRIILPAINETCILKINASKAITLQLSKREQPNLPIMKSYIQNSIRCDQS